MSKERAHTLQKLTTIARTMVLCFAMFALAVSVISNTTSHTHSIEISDHGHSHDPVVDDTPQNYHPLDHSHHGGDHTHDKATGLSLKESALTFAVTSIYPQVNFDLSSSLSYRIERPPRA